MSSRTRICLVALRGIPPIPMVGDGGHGLSSSRPPAGSATASTTMGEGARFARPRPLASSIMGASCSRITPCRPRKRSRSCRDRLRRQPDMAHHPEWPRLVVRETDRSPPCARRPPADSRTGPVSRMSAKRCGKSFPGFPHRTERQIHDDDALAAPRAHRLGMQHHHWRWLTGRVVIQPVQDHAKANSPQDDRPHRPDRRGARRAVGMP